MSTEDYWRGLLKRNAELYGQNKAALRTLLLQNRGYVSEVPRDERVIVLCSGGMDSTALVDASIRYWGCKVILLYFRRNARSQQWEEEAFDFFVGFYQQRYPGDVIDSLKLNVEIPLCRNREYLDRSRHEIMGLPLRNMTMWSNAIAQAAYLSGKYGKTVRTVLVGSVAEDEVSPESGSLSVLAGTVAACVCSGVWYYQILAPLQDGSLGRKWSKLDILKYARENQIPLDRTRSCFGNSATPCGTCLGCRNRNKAYQSLERDNVQ